MSAGIEFNTDILRVQPSEKRIFFRTDGENKVFYYDIHCTNKKQFAPINFFFNLSNMSAIICLNRSSSDGYKCAKMMFRLGIGDMPVMTIHWLHNQDELVYDVLDSFRDQYASYLIDKQINS
jgi:hypothetical protein